MIPTGAAAAGPAEARRCTGSWSVGARLPGAISVCAAAAPPASTRRSRSSNSIASPPCVTMIRRQAPADSSPRSRPRTPQTRHRRLLTVFVTDGTLPCRTKRRSGYAPAWDRLGPGRGARPHRRGNGGSRPAGDDAAAPTGARPRSCAMPQRPSPTRPSSSTPLSAAPRHVTDAAAWAAYARRLAEELHTGPAGPPPVGAAPKPAASAAGSPSPPTAEHPAAPAGSALPIEPDASPTSSPAPPPDAGAPAGGVLL